MLKGVNRQVIELTQVDSDYYERALLVVKPKYENFEENVLKQDAKNLIAKLGVPSYIRKRNKLIYWGIRLGLAALFGAISASALLYIFYV